MKEKLPKPLTGIIPPMVTPLLDDRTLDVAGLEKLIEHILAGGVHGLFILGSTGEAPALSYRLRYELVERVCRQVNRRVPILVGISDTSSVESVKLAEFAKYHGTSAVVLAPPYYFQAGQAELLEYLGHMDSKIDLPIFLYNMPGCTKVMIEPETVLRASQLPHISGLKDSSANMVYFHKVLHLLKNNSNFSLLVGPEELLAETVLLGGHGGVCGGANIAPSLYVDLYHAAKIKDLDRVNSLHDKIISVSTALYSVGQYGSSYLKGVKCALSIMGLCNDFMLEPFHRFRSPERKKIELFLQQLDL